MPHQGMDNQVNIPMPRVTIYYRYNHNHRLLSATRVAEYTKLNIELELIMALCVECDEPSYTPIPGVG